MKPLAPTLSQLPPLVVAACAVEWRVMPPVFLTITLWDGGLDPPATVLKLSCVGFKSIFAAPETQFEKGDVFSPAADAVAETFRPAGMLKGVEVLPLASVCTVISLRNVLPCSLPESHVGLEKNSIVYVVF